MQISAQFVAEQHVRMLRLERAADQHMRRLARANAGKGRIDSGHSGTFLAHKGT